MLYFISKAMNKEAAHMPSLIKSFFIDNSVMALETMDLFYLSYNALISNLLSVRWYSNIYFICSENIIK